MSVRRCLTQTITNTTPGRSRQQPAGSPSILRAPSSRGVACARIMPFRLQAAESGNQGDGCEVQNSDLASELRLEAQHADARSPKPETWSLKSEAWHLKPCHPEP
jgi:hypothetical protein